MAADLHDLRHESEDGAVTDPHKLQFGGIVRLGALVLPQAVRLQAPRAQEQP